MLFNSYAFIFGYLPVTLAGFFLLARNSHRLAALWLAAASLFFYGWWNPVFVVLVLASITVNYAFGYAIGHARQSSAPKAKQVLTIAVVANLGMLAYFKYANFFFATASQLTGVETATLDIVLPLGISFFTFTQIAFLVDVYRGIAREYNFIHYVLFVTYFPHLIAGPVLHHKEMMPQFAHPSTYRVSSGNVATGLLLFTLGLSKKVLWADSLAPIATTIFDGTRHAMTTGTLPTIYEVWFGALAYTLQIYFDFSGYSDMALGAALMFGIRLPINFNSPYKATSIIEFWRHWHMTLSRFLRDYLYIPLGGNRKGELRRYLNLMVTMLLGGLWHGAGLTFIVWGALHFAYLAINHLWREIVGARLVSIPNWLSALAGGTLTFVAVVAAWVIFRADNIAHGLFILKAMFGIASLPISFDAVINGNLLLTDKPNRDLVLLLVLGMLSVWLLPNTQEIVHKMRISSGIGMAYAILTAALATLCILNISDESPFLYFQF